MENAVVALFWRQTGSRVVVSQIGGIVCGGGGRFLDGGETQPFEGGDSSEEGFVGFEDCENFEDFVVGVVDAVAFLVPAFPYAAIVIRTKLGKDNSPKHQLLEDWKRIVTTPLSKLFFNSKSR